MKETIQELGWVFAFAVVFIAVIINIRSCRTVEEIERSKSLSVCVSAGMEYANGSCLHAKMITPAN